MPTKVELQVLSGRRRATHSAMLDVGDEITIGSGSDCQIRYDDQHVAALHAVLRVESGRLVIVNRSINGTSINGELSERALLRIEDVASFGESASIRVIEIAEPSDRGAPDTAERAVEEKKSALSGLGNNPLILAGAALYLLVGLAAAAFYMSRSDAAGTTILAREHWDVVLAQTEQELLTADLPPAAPGVLPLELRQALAGIVSEPSRLYATLVVTRAQAGDGSRENARLIVTRIRDELDRRMTAAWKAEATGRPTDAVWLYRDMLEIVPVPASTVFRGIQNRLAALPQVPVRR